MADWRDYSIKVSNFKCFGEEPQGFDCLKPINIIIGKNNSGKSALIDAIELFSGNSFWHAAEKLKLIDLSSHKYFVEQSVTGVVFDKLIQSVNYFRGSDSVSSLKVLYELSRAKNNDELLKVSVYTLSDRLNSHIRAYEGGLNHHFKNIYEPPLRGAKFFRLAAERNIIPEDCATCDLRNMNIDMNQNGENATKILYSYANSALMDSSVVDNRLLGYVNEVCGPDQVFKSIRVKQLPEKSWEVYLEQSGKGLIPLTHSGSGIKTIILTLLCLHTISFQGQRVFALEEPENNLHPSLLRRLFSHIREVCTQKGKEFPVFITTHSSVAIDMFSRDYESQIVHVKHDGKNATCETVAGFGQRSALLDDLGVKASDLLQSNCIIWVEGPSDVIYLRHWIDLWSENILKEGLHYQCVFYGGSLISHLTAADPERINSYVKLLRVCRNAIIVIDSDRKSKAAHFKKSAKRIEAEAAEIGSYCWITEGREIENYIPQAAVTSIFGKKSKSEFGAFDDIEEYLGENDGKRFGDDKVGFARRFVAILPNKNDWLQENDLDDKMNAVVAMIRKANYI